MKTTKTVGFKKLTRDEMKKVMGGTAPGGGDDGGCGSIQTSCSSCPTGCACKIACTICSPKA